jgi:hypothetical protein
LLTCSSWSSGEPATISSGLPPVAHAAEMTPMPRI